MSESANEPSIPLSRAKELLSKLGQRGSSGVTTQTELTIEEVIFLQAVACAFAASWAIECQFYTQMLLDMQPPG